MRQHVTISIRITMALVVITCGLYPAIVWGIGQVAFPRQANGSLIVRQGNVIGSELIGQNFVGERFFHPRPSAAGTDGYDSMASGGTNLGPTSKKLRDSIAASIRGYSEVRPAIGIPADAVTASASGLDPHISPENAFAQAPRVARANGLPAAAMRGLIARHIERRFLGIYGEPRVNVLLLNLGIEELPGR